MKNLTCVFLPQQTQLSNWLRRAYNCNLILRFVILFIKYTIVLIKNVVLLTQLKVKHYIYHIFCNFYCVSLQVIESMLKSFNIEVKNSKLN
jgi:hypothetical protein